MNTTNNFNISMLVVTLVLLAKENSANFLGPQNSAIKMNSLVLVI